MKRIAIVLTALGALSVLTASSAHARDWHSGAFPGHAGFNSHGRLHDELEHRAFHRELTHREAHRHPMNWQQHERLHDHLEHEAFHDHLEHRAVHRAFDPRLNQGFSVGRLGGRGFRIQTPGFNFLIGR